MSNAPRVLKVLFLTIFIDLLGYGILIPVVPQLLANSDSPFFLLPAGLSVSEGYMILGLLVAIFPFGQFLATPLLGQLSDRYGRKPILIISILGTAVSYVLFAIGIIYKNIPLLFISRFFDGVTGGNISVAQATIADVTTPENRAKSFGLIGAAFGLGFILGPYIGGKLSDPHLVHWFTAATPFWFAALLALANVISISFFLSETNTHRMTVLRMQWGRSFKNIARAFHLPQLRGLFVTNFFYTAGFAFFTTFFSVFLINRFGFSQGKIGTFFAFIGLWSVITQGLITRYVAQKKSEEYVLSFSLFGTGLILLAYFLPSTPLYLYIIVPFFSILNGLSMANITALVSRRAAGTIQGEILGLNASVLALAQFIPAVLSGFIAEIITPNAPLVLSSVTIVIAGALFLFIGKKKHEQISG